MLKVSLSTLPKGSKATVHTIVPLYPNDAIARRLEELGFVSGEYVEVIARTPFKAGPMVVKTHLTRFALRQSEASRIFVTQHTL